MIMKVSIPVETGNRVLPMVRFKVRFKNAWPTPNPKLPTSLKITATEPRTSFLDMTDSSQLPALAEPFFLAFNARLTVRPAMNLQDLMNAGPGIERAVKNYGWGAS